MLIGFGPTSVDMVRVATLTCVCPSLEKVLNKLHTVFFARFR